MSKSDLLEMSADEADSTIQAAGAVNLDEVTNEVIRVKVSEFKEVPVTDDEGQPLLGDDGKPLKRRKYYPRTAEIYDLVPLPLYNKMLKLRSQMQSGQISLEESVSQMGSLVYEVWKRSEPWMTEEHLYEILHGDTIATIFVRFFSKSRLRKT